MSVRRPTVRRPKIPKLKRPSISKKKKIVKNIPTLGKKKTRNAPQQSKKKTIRKASIGTCYSQKNCKGVLAKRVTKSGCEKQGGKSWRKEKGNCENI